MTELRDSRVDQPSRDGTPRMGVAGAPRTVRPRPFWACHLSRPLRVLGVLCALAVLNPLRAAAETLSVSDLLARQPAWEEMAEKGEQVRLEGRVESASGLLIRLRKLPLPLRPANDAFPDLRRGTNRVEAVGRITRRGMDLVFTATELKEVPSDAENYALRESALDAGDPADWYGLADWAAARGGFYDDRFLLDKATEARRKGLALERQIATNDAAALAALAAKADGFGLAELRQELTHESLRVRWDGLRQDPSSDLAPLLEQAASLLPGAAAPLALWPADLSARYAAEPLASYNRADAEERSTLDRLFFAEVQLVAIERLADPEGADGELIAARIASVLPERADLAEAYREREIDYRLQRIEVATRSEALDLAKRLEERGRADEARRALTAWLAAREAALRKDGPAGLVVVAEDYASVLGDKETAARLLIEAAMENPKSADIRDRLDRLGYVLYEGEWITKEEAEKKPVDPIKLAIREGRVTAGMSPEQVRKALGIPDRVARAAIVSQVHEAWVYGQAGRGGLVVHLLRYSARGEARVVGVGGLTR